MHLPVHVLSANKGTATPGVRPLICFFCGKEGHFRHACPLLLNAK